MKSRLIVLLFLFVVFLLSCSQNNKSENEASRYIFNSIQPDLGKNCTICKGYYKDDCLYYVYRIEPELPEEYLYDSYYMTPDQMNEKYPDFEYEPVSKIGKYDIIKGEKTDICEIDENGLTFYYADFESGRVGSGVTLANEEGECCFGDSMTGEILHRKGITYMFDGVGDVSFFVKDSSGMYAYYAETGELSLYLDWMETGLVGSYVSTIEDAGDNGLFCVCDDHTLNYSFGYIERSDEPVQEKTVIRCAALNSDNDRGHDLQQAIIDYNKASDNIKVEYVSYAKSMSPISDFAKDVIADNIPDVLDISSINMYEYVSQGIFEDLTPFLENDDVLNKDYFVPGVLEATAMDDKQYYIFGSFGIDTVAAKKSDITDYPDGWNMKEFIDYFHSKAKGTKLYYEESKMDVFDKFVAQDIESYIDRDTGKVRFDSDEFKAAASFCNEFPKVSEPNENDVEDYTGMYERVKNGKILINTLPLTCDMYQFNEKLFDDNVAFIGYPSNDKKGHELILSRGSLAMSAFSKKKEAAWDFIKKVILNEKSNEWDSNMLPAGNNKFEEYLRSISTTEKYVKEDGTVVMPLRGSIVIENISYEIKPFSDDKIQVIRDIIKNSRVRYNNNKAVDIVRGELEEYFTDRKSLDEVIVLIQDKMNKYVNENIIQNR